MRPFEKAKGRPFPDHTIPSESYFEKKVGEVETALKADPLTMVTNYAQEQHNLTPGARPSQNMEFDSTGHGVLKTQKKDLYTTMPDDEASLNNRFEVMGAMPTIFQSCFMANPILATASLELMREYSDWLCGEHVWGFAVKGTGGAPLASPTLARYAVTTRQSGTCGRG